jgi:hypothetical protein
MKHYITMVVLGAMLLLGGCDRGLDESLSAAEKGVQVAEGLVANGEESITAAEAALVRVQEMAEQLDAEVGAALVARAEGYLAEARANLPALKQGVEEARKLKDEIQAKRDAGAGWKGLIGVGIDIVLALTGAGLARTAWKWKGVATSAITLAQALRKKAPAAEEDVEVRDAIEKAKAEQASLNMRAKVDKIRTAA